MRKILFLIMVIALSSYVTGQMLTEETDTEVNISFLLENLTQAEINVTQEADELDEGVDEVTPEVIVISEKQEEELNINQKDLDCQLKHECRPRDDYFYFDCYFDENISDCRCYVGLFSRCNLEASNLSIIAKPSVREKFRITYLKDKLRPIMPLLRFAKGVLYNWRTYVLGLLLILILIIIFYAYNRDTPLNNMRKARSHHKKAQKLYEKGKYEQSEKHYKIAEEYRKKVKEF